MAARTNFTSKCGLPNSEKRKNLLAVCKWQIALSAKNAGETRFLSSAIQAQIVVDLYGEAGIIIRHVTGHKDWPFSDAKVGKYNVIEQH
jgi:hypothetical protein